MVTEAALVLSQEIAIPTKAIRPKLEVVYISAGHEPASMDTQTSLRVLNKRRYNSAERRQQSRQDEKTKAVQALLDRFYMWEHERGGRLHPIAKLMIYGEVGAGSVAGPSVPIIDRPHELDEVERGLKTLTPRQQALVKNYYTTNVPFIMIAGKLNMEERAARNMLSLCHKLLAAFLTGAGVVLIAY